MVLRHLVAVAAICSSFSSSQELLPRLNPRIHYNTIEIVCSEGYYIQEHKVETDDGYILTIYRMPNGKRHSKIPPKRSHYQEVHEGYHPDFRKCVNDSRQQVATGPPVLLSHGVLSSSDGWVLQGPGNDLAFMLLDRGYDVWLSNIRGNFYSRRHKTLRPSRPEFWDFSFHENGIYDIPNIIDYILASTKYQKISYVGHSMGSTMFFVMASFRPEYNDKVHLFVGMSPVTQIRRLSYAPDRRVVLNTVMALMKACDRVGVQEFLPRTNLSDLLFKTLCAPGSLFQNLCYDVIFAILGYPSKLYRRKLFPTYLSHLINGVSVKTFLHYDQFLDAPSFRCYDYGPEKNVQRYGQPDPPEYDLRKVRTPAVLFYSADDYVLDVKDAVRLKAFLPNLVEAHELSKYNHVDFIWAYTAKDLIYSKVLRVFDDFSNRSDSPRRLDSFESKTFPTSL